MAADKKTAFRSVPRAATRAATRDAELRYAALVTVRPPCHVYRNLHTGGWSVRLCSTRRVFARLESIDLVDCEFRVSEAGRVRAVREGRRNVHAVVAGRPARRRALKGPTADVSYNPFRSPHFCDRATGRPLARAARVRFSADGRATAYRPEFHS